MRLGKSLSLGILLLFSTLACFAQSKAISHDDYWTPYRDALEKARKISRRQILKTEKYKDGKVTKTDEWLYEYIMPDAIHFTHTEASGGKTLRTEEINIGPAKYCKRGDEPWATITSYCIVGSASVGVSNILSEQFGLEKSKLDGRDTKQYRWFVTNKDSRYSSNDDQWVAYFETKYWLDKDGLIIREENRHGMLDPDRIDVLTIETYEYDPIGLKIEAPIK